MIGLVLFYVDVLFMCGENVFNFLESWNFSKECLWNLVC